ncbi:XRE family transcriptional regulator [Spongiactinospora sp. TRM90649]|uniref:XRE family transcriptional regulator n=1 Tax=Spongiactinospora sp. TRM90649 TaxID=3031114 RepID=UPI0023F6BE23|nr:XRE family transcriptional regulator [Spongiactinospora sp. TRM90649]MDF5758632.1 XRE family transcriptional regulator [Spongiactinospora sp. TRM90649]
MIYGTRLTQAREFCLLTQKALADDVGISQGTLSNAERDKSELPMHVLTQLATITGFPIDFFQQGPQVTFEGLPTHFRARAGMSMKEAGQAKRGGEIVAEAALAMLSQLEGPPLRLQPHPIGTAPQAAAAAAREALGLGPRDPALGLPVLLEHVGFQVIALPLPNTRRDAFSLWINDHPILALLDTDAGDRQLWSTAHELGHTLLHRDAGASNTLEQEADEFAMHLLMPLEAMNKEMPTHPTIQDFALLKRRWGVSIAALIRTAHRIGRIDDHRYTSLFKQMAARGERLRERAAIAPTKPRGFRAMAETLHGPHPAQGLARAANWTPAFAEDVLSRHATGAELPSRRITNVISLSSRRARRA